MFHCLQMRCVRMCTFR
uniref:Uncharacterized protein n=1 Tax=Anguilla anguilla TaxID=7936 RepID=A0A0E9UGL2_ANGAN